MWWPSPLVMIGTPVSIVDWRAKCIQRWSFACCCSSLLSRAWSVMVIFFPSPGTRSSRAPVVELLLQFQVDERLGRLHAVEAADPGVEERDQLIVVLAHDLRHGVETAGREHDVRDLGDLGQLLREAPRV